METHPLIHLYKATLANRLSTTNIVIVFEQIGVTLKIWVCTWKVEVTVFFNLRISSVENMYIDIVYYHWWSNVLILCVHSQQPTYLVDTQMATFVHILSSLWGGSPSTRAIDVSNSYLVNNKCLCIFCQHYNYIVDL